MKTGKKSSALILLALLASAGLIGCSPDVEESSSSVPTHVEMTNLSFDSRPKSLELNKEVQLSITIAPLDASNQKVRYSSSDTSVATISETGLLKAVGLGKATITAEAVEGGLKDSFNIQVIPEGYSLMGIDALSEAMANTPYQNKVIGEASYGLSAIDKVGVDETTLKETLYPIPSDSEFAAESILNLDNLTLETIQSVIPSATEINDFYRFQAALLLAKKINQGGQKAKIKLPKRTLRIEGKYALDQKNKYVLVVDGLNGTYIEGDETEVLLVVDGVNWQGYMQVTDSKDVHLSGVTFNAETPSNLTASVTKYDVENKKITLAIDPEFNPLVKRLLDYKEKNGKLFALRSYLEFHPTTRIPLQTGSFFVDSFDGYVISGDETKGYSIEVGAKLTVTENAIGTLATLQFSQYDAQAFNFDSCENLYLENLTLTHASGMAFTANYGKNFYINRFDLKLKEGSNSLMTATADGLHLNCMSGDVTITNSLLENSHDDALNIKHGYWYAVTNVKSSTNTVTLKRKTQSVRAPKVGDKIEIYEAISYEGHNPSSGSYTVETVEKASNGDFNIKFREKMTGVSSWSNDCLATFVSDMPKLTFKNNIVRNKRNRGLLIQVRGAVIENNAFMNVAHGALSIGNAINNFNEGTLPRDVTIRNNKLINDNYLGGLEGDILVYAQGSNGSVAPKGTIRNVLIENNFIAKNADAAVCFRGASEGQVKNNLFYDASRLQPHGDGYNSVITANNSTDITLEGNYNYYTLDRGQSGIILQGTTGEDDLILNKNFDINFQQIGDAGPEVDVPLMDKEITIDGELTEWADSTAYKVPLAGATDAYGNQHQIASLEDHFKVEELYLTHNEKGLYLAYKVFDNELNFKTTNDFWMGDVVEVFGTAITDKPNADFSVYKDEGAVFHLASALTWDGQLTVASSRTNSAYLEHASDIKTVMKRNDTGYQGELFIPFTFAPGIKTAIDEGKCVDMAIVIADAPRPSLDLERIQVANVAHNVESNKTKSARMPQYLFKK